MSPLTTLVLQATISLLCSLLLITVLRQPLTRTLIRLCPDTDAAAFWWAYASTMLVGAPLALVLSVNLLAPGITAVDQLRTALLTSLCGLLWGMHLLGRRLSTYLAVPTIPGAISAPTPDGREGV